jgi:hypothetical protein
MDNSDEMNRARLKNELDKNRRASLARELHEYAEKVSRWGRVCDPRYRTAVQVDCILRAAALQKLTQLLSDAAQTIEALDPTFCTVIDVGVLCRGVPVQR